MDINGEKGMNKNLVIGMLGGMGTYATIHAFKQYAEVFPAEKEWERPRIIIDNRCTMPSRVRAYLYREGKDELINEMTNSLKNLVHLGSNKVLLACNTSHLFLPMIIEQCPELEQYIVDMISTCSDRIQRDGVKEVYLLGSEGTIDSQIYQKALNDRGINCEVPQKQTYPQLRQCIEAVKQNRFNKTIKDSFLQLMNESDYCVLGCTELPVLYEEYRKNVTCKKVYDPLRICFEKLREEYYDE